MGSGLSSGSSLWMFASEKQVHYRCHVNRRYHSTAVVFPILMVDPVELKTFKCTSNVVAVDLRWWPFPPTISGSRRRARIRRSKDSVTPSTALASPCFQRSASRGKGGKIGWSEVRENNHDTQEVKPLKSKCSDPVCSQAGIAIGGGDPSSRVDRRWREASDRYRLRGLGLL